MKTSGKPSPSQTATDLSRILGYTGLGALFGLLGGVGYGLFFSMFLALGNVHGGSLFGDAVRELGMLKYALVVGAGLGALISLLPTRSQQKREAGQPLTRG